MYHNKRHNTILLENELRKIFSLYIGASIFSDTSLFEEDIEGLNSLGAIIAGIAKLSMDNAAQLMCIKERSQKDGIITDTEMREIVKNAALLVCDIINGSDENMSTYEDDDIEEDFLNDEEDVMDYSYADPREELP